MQAVCKNCNIKFKFPKCMSSCEKLSKFQKSLVNKIFIEKDISDETFKVSFPNERRYAL